MGKIVKYVVWLILFFIFSEIIINVSLESNYDKIERKDTLEQITIEQADATKVNGRIFGKIFNDENNRIENKYLRIDLFSERDILLGSKYIDVSNMRENETRDLEIHFKLQDVEYYNMSFTDEKEENVLIIPEIVADMTKGEILLGTLLAFAIFR